MQEHTGYLPGLPPIAGKKIQAAFDGGMLSSDAGVVLLREVKRRLGDLPVSAPPVPLLAWPACRAARATLWANRTLGRRKARQLPAPKHHSNQFSRLGFNDPRPFRGRRVAPPGPAHTPGRPHELPAKGATLAGSCRRALAAKSAILAVMVSPADLERIMMARIAY